MRVPEIFIILVTSTSDCRSPQGVTLVLPGVHASRGPCAILVSQSRGSGGGVRRSGRMNVAGMIRQGRRSEFLPRS